MPEIHRRNSSKEIARRGSKEAPKKDYETEKVVEQPKQDM